MKTLLVLIVSVVAVPLPSVVMAQRVAIAEPGKYPSADLAAFHGNPATLTNAIATVQQSTGGKVMEIRFLQDNGKPGFHAVVLKSGQVQFVRLEPPSKQIVQLTDRPEWMLKYEQKAELKQAAAAQVSLAQAIQTAEKAQGAPAVAAGIAHMPSSSEVHAYNIMVDDRGSLRRIAVDNSTGEVIADLEGYEQWPDWGS
jgi:uncharacterized membrane protein YkoI